MPPRTRTHRDPSPEEGEDFDLDNVSGSDNDDAPGPANQPANAAINTVAEVVNNPDSEARVSSKKNAAHDVWHFFMKTDGFSVCRVCKYVAYSYLLSLL